MVGIGLNSYVIAIIWLCPFVVFLKLIKVIK